LRDLIDKRYLYNGKELHEQLGLNWYDYGARWYDAAVGQWWQVDPLAEKYYSWSGYNYVMDSPLLLVDPDGRASEWVPRIANGKIQLVAEFGDNLQTLKSYFAGSSRFSSAQLEVAYNSAKGGVIVDLPQDNYSRAIRYSQENSDDFPSLEEASQMSWDEARSSANYNCYHFCVNGAWEKEIYSFWWSYGEYIMEPEDFQHVLDNYFIPVSLDEAIYGETIITMNYSGGFPMHSAIYAGRDKEGNVYILEKYGAHEAPKIRKLSDTNYSDFKFYNEKVKE